MLLPRSDSGIELDSSAYFWHPFYPVVETKNNSDKQNSNVQSILHRQSARILGNQKLGKSMENVNQTMQSNHEYTLKLQIHLKNIHNPSNTYNRSFKVPQFPFLFRHLKCHNVIAQSPGTHKPHSQVDKSPMWVNFHQSRVTSSPLWRIQSSCSQGS